MLLISSMAHFDNQYMYCQMFASQNNFVITITVIMNSHLGRLLENFGPNDFVNPFFLLPNSLLYCILQVFKIAF